MHCKILRDVIFSENFTKIELEHISIKCAKCNTIFNFELVRKINVLLAHKKNMSFNRQNEKKGYYA